ncbi:hypothetical protein [Mesomycoplasma neurolyticum]|uniref:Uncharacterized protein n=1 Tax=Mesomycoplasma neurolyticum TaxID=2120 RepID=A0A449A4Z8_9BACT|nr:hypothetical protein [Mesomycoplasma neurolyticum]VEU59284.1 Uncharacterised protein [Mesomycoplasma neurolyticum]
MKIKKILKFSALGVLATTPFLSFISCGNESEQEKEIKIAIKELKESLKTDTTAQNLKTKFEGYSKDAMTIVGSKQEINLQSEALIKAFNEYYGTNLTFKQYGGTTNPGTIITTKMSSSGGIGDLLMYAIEPRSEFEGRLDKLIDTSPKAILEHDGDITGTIKFENENKSFLPQVYEYYGVVYNKDLFIEKGVNVYEGKSFDNAKVSNLQKSDAYDGTIEKDNKLYVFTNDLKESGYRKVISFLKSKGVANPFYSLAKAGTGDLWPISTHLIAGAISTIANPQVWNDEKKIITQEVIDATKKALEIMGYTTENDGKKTNNVSSGLAELAVGTTAMIQGGTFSEPDVKRNKNDVKLGLFPLPIFNKNDQTAMIYRGAAQKWAITALAKDESKLKTAKMFLQFLYKTKTGYEFLSKTFKFISPYGVPNGATNVLEPDSLLASAVNYEGENNVNKWIHDNFPEGFNTDNQILLEAANNGYANNDTLTKVQTEYKALLNGKKK